MWAECSMLIKEPIWLYYLHAYRYLLFIYSRKKKRSSKLAVELVPMTQRVSVLGKHFFRENSPHDALLCVFFLVVSCVELCRSSHKPPPTCRRLHHLACVVVPITQHSTSWFEKRPRDHNSTQYVQYLAAFETVAVPVDC